MSYFKELAWNFIGATEKNDVSLQSDEPDRRVRSNGVFPEREAKRCSCNLAGKPLIVGNLNTVFQELSAWVIDAGDCNKLNLGGILCDSAYITGIVFHLLIHKSITIYYLNQFSTAVGTSQSAKT
jgi:hypothetical protein